MNDQNERDFFGIEGDENTPNSATNPQQNIYGDDEAQAYFERLITSDGESAPSLFNLPDEEKPDDVEEARSRSQLNAYDWVQTVVSTVLVLLLVFFFAARQISVEGPSMLKTLVGSSTSYDSNRTGDRVLITSQYTSPKVGDIVIIHVESFGDVPIVKRVIAVAGQTLSFDTTTHRVVRDGVPLDEPYINEPPMQWWITWAGSETITVPDGTVFVMGDNRNHSSDSRSNEVAFVDTRTVIGTVQLILLPGIDDSGTRDWGRFGIVK
ncbi:MAG: signal peptidase I [Oscillospiraceae bacterium]|jgi:signal peptidase I|nr:signal peptidase I [Oscillospiraceae bacterium]